MASLSTQTNTDPTKRYNVYCEDVNESYCKIDFSEIEDIYLLTDTKVAFAEQLSAFASNYRHNPKYRAGLWDGKVRFYKIVGQYMVFPKGLWKYLLRKTQTAQELQNINFVYKSTTEYFKVTFEEFNDFILSLNMPFAPYDYQVQAAYDAITQGRLTIGAATSSGKSCIIYLIYSWMIKHNLKTMLIVPNVMLTKQMYQDFQDYGMQNIDDYITLIGGDECKTIDEKRILFADSLNGGTNIISTWQSLYNSSELFDSIDCIIVDEVHSAKSTVFSDIILPAAVNSKYRLGLTGTMPPDYTDKLSILGSLGPHKTYIDAQGLIERGLATPVEIHMMFLNYSDVDKEQMKSIRNYADEVKFLEMNQNRTNYITKVAAKVSSKGNTLVMFNTIAHGKSLLETYLKHRFNITNLLFLDSLTPKNLATVPKDAKKVFVNTNLDEKQKSKIIKAGLDPDIFESLEQYNIYIIFGNIDDTERERIRQIMELVHDATLFASYGTMSTGVSIRNIHYILLTASTKSPIRLQQTVGRGMRKHETKEKMIILDFIDDFSRVNKQGNVIESSKNHTLKHSEERISLYVSNRYPITEREIFLS